LGAAASYTDEGPPEKISPLGDLAWIASIEALKGRISQ
jgi:hypothetical protein